VVGEATRAAAGDAFVYRVLDRVAVVGRREPLCVYELVGRRGTLPPDVLARLARWDEAITLYRARRWKEAASLLDELQAADVEDGPLAVYRQRVAMLLEHPPGEDWDGIYVAPTK
jgi:adenylate cyclase